MQDHSLKSRLLAGRHTLPATIMVAVAGWLLPGGQDWVEALFACLVTAYLLVLLNNRHALIRVRASLQSSIYLLLATAFVMLHTSDMPGWWVSAAYVLSLSALFDGYHHRYPAADLCHSFTFISAGALLWPPMLALLPVYWVSAWYLHALDWRSLTASFVGLALPWWCYGACLYCSDRQAAVLQTLWQRLQPEPLFSGWADLALWQWATLGFMIVLLVVSAIHFVYHPHDEKLSTRHFLHCLLWTDGAFLVLTLLWPGSINTLLCLLMVGTSVFAGRYFISTHERPSRLFFHATWLALAFLFALHLWMH